MSRYKNIVLMLVILVLIAASSVLFVVKQGQNGIVLSSAQKNVNDLPDLSIASAHGVNLSLPGQGRQINRELI